VDVRTVIARRHFLAAVAVASLPVRALAQSGVGAEKLGENIHLIRGAGNNILLVVGPDGCLMVDSGTADHAADTLKLVAELSGGKPVRTLINTHWHPEATGGNDAIVKVFPGAKIVAHENTRLWMSTDVNLAWQKKLLPPRDKAALPNQTFYTTGKMTFGAEPIEYGYLGQAHTDSDIYVLLHKANILVTGDVITVGTYPVLDYVSGGWIGGMNTAAKTLSGLAKADTKVVPGAGPVQTKADLDDESKMLAAVYDRLVKLIRQGAGAKDMIAAAPTKEFDAKWGNPELLIGNAYPGMWGHVRELGGIV
jgi:cyclase